MRAGLFLLLLPALSVLGCADDTRTNTGDSQLHLLDLDGNRASLWQPGASATVALFVRSDCPISNRYALKVRQLYQRFYPRGVEFFLIYVHPNEATEEIRAHLEEFRFPCLALRDPFHTLVSATGARVTPEAAVFDGNRRMTYLGRIDDLYLEFGRSRSEATTDELAEALAATLAGQDVDDPYTTAVGCYIADLRK